GLCEKCAKKRVDGVGALREGVCSREEVVWLARSILSWQIRAVNVSGDNSLAGGSGLKKKANTPTCFTSNVKCCCLPRVLYTSFGSRHNSCFVFFYFPFLLSVSLYVVPSRLKVFRVCDSV
ncbi:unnamed protein product, partial [Pylaiella littoralis]